MHTAPFILVEDLGNGPIQRFCWTGALLAQADAVRSSTVRRMLRNHLDETDYASVRKAVGRLETFRENLDLWRDFVVDAPVNTSRGELTTADLPSILSAISILDPIIAAARGETTPAVEAA